MGVQITTPMGATGGAGVFTAVDNGVELTSIATAIETFAAQSATQSSALITEIERLRLTIAALQSSVSRAADNSGSIAKAVDNINSAVGSVSVAVHDATTTQQTLAANLIKTNNFNTEVTKATLIKTGQSDTLATVEAKNNDIAEQVKTAVKDGFIIHTEVKAAGFITRKIEDAILGIQNWVSGTEIFQTVSKWLSNQKDTLLSFVNLGSPAKIKEDLAATSGTPGTPAI